jgi:hypothetical protein
VLTLVVYDSATGEKDVIHRPSNSQSLDFATVEVISRDNIIPSADLKNKYLDFSKQHGWKESSNSVFLDKIMLCLFLLLLFRFRAS